MNGREDGGDVSCFLLHVVALQGLKLKVGWKDTRVLVVTWPEVRNFRYYRSCTMFVF